MLVAVVGLNLTAAYSLLAASEPSLDHIFAAWQSALGHGVPLIVGVAAVVLNSVLSSDTKARIIYLDWDNPYPASRAFTDLGPRDVRVDMAYLETHHAPLPTDPRQQNGLWYRLLRQHSDEPSVNRSHREFLLLRDYAVLSLFFLALGVYVGALRHWDAIAFGYATLLTAQFGLTLMAAQERGRRFVTNVLAIASNPK